MRIRHKAVLFAALLLASASAVAQSNQNDPVSATVIGNGNPLFNEAVEALRTKQYEQGVELTLQGLKYENAPRAIAAALSNLCAGYAGLKQYALALRSCNESMAIDDHNWRVWNNRAAAH